MYVKQPDDHDEKESTSNGRRTILKGIGGTIGSGLLASLAGCLGDGSAEASGEPVRELEFVSYTRDHEQIHTALSEIADRMEDELGFDIDFQPMNRDRMITRTFTERSHDLSSLGYTGRPHRLDPHMLLYRNNHSSQTASGGYNWSNYVDEETDELLERQARIMDPEERVDAVKEAQAYLMDQPAGEMPIVHGNLINVLNRERFDNWVNVAGLGYKNYWTWTQVTPKTDRTQLVSAYTVSPASGGVNPLSAGEANLIIHRLTHDKLIRLDEDAQPTGSLATNWDVSDDGTTVTFHLREELPEFHDGEQLTAEDVAFSYNWIKEHQIPFYEDAVDPVENAEAIDDHTVVIELEEEFAPIWVLAFSRVFILPKHIWENVPEEVGADMPWETQTVDEDLFDNGIIGSGPFQFTHIRRGEEIGVEANPDHWDAPEIDEMVIRIVPEASAQTRMLETGEVDFLIEASANPDVLEDLATENDHLSFEAIDSVGYDELAMNTRRPPLDDPDVRGAISSIIPKDQIAEEMFRGYARPAHSPTAPVLEFWFNEDVKRWTEYSADEAREMLEDAGYGFDDDGILYYPEGEVPDEIPDGPPDN